MTVCGIESCSSLEDLFQRLQSCYKRFLLPNQPTGTHPWVIMSPDTTDNGRGIYFVERDDSSRDMLLQDLAEVSQICFAGECLTVKYGPPESLKAESASSMITILAELLARENKQWPFSWVGSYFTSNSITFWFYVDRIVSVKSSGHLLHIVCCCNCKRAYKEDHVHSPDAGRCVSGRLKTSSALPDNSQDLCSGFLEVTVVTQHLVPDLSSYQNRVTFTFSHPLISRRTSSAF